jgi:PAS domain S-box-containing protein
VVKMVDLILELGKIAREESGEALAKIASAVLKFFHTDAAAVLLYDPSVRSAYVAASISKSDSLLVQSDITLRVTSGSSLYQAALNPTRPLIVPAEAGDPVLGAAGGMTAAVIPMVYSGAVPGFLLLGSRDRQVLLRNDADLLMAVAALSALVGSAMRFKESLSESEERYRMLTETAAGLAFVLDQGGRFLYVNHRAKDVLGYESNDVIGRYFGEFVSPETWAKTTAALKDAVSRQAKYVEYEWVVQRRDGSEVTLEVEASLSYQGFELRRHQGIAREPSAERLLQEELQKTGRELSEVRSREGRMREYLSVASMAQEQERARIAREIHDGAVQYLVAMRRRLDLLRKELDRKNASPSDTLTDLDSLLDKATSDLRQFARNLRPPVLDDFGLVSACEWLADQTAKEGIRVVFSPTGEIRRLPPEVEVSAFRIVQEALSNVVKHSGASQAEVTLHFAPHELSISLSDNGRGFVLDQSPGSLGRAGQMGLVGMFERAELMGAAMDLTSEPGKGTRLSVVIPLAKPER